MGISYDQGFIKFDFLPSYLSWFQISTYGFMLALSFISGRIILRLNYWAFSSDKGVAYEMIDTIVGIGIIGGIVGAKIFFVFETWNDWHGFSGMIARLFSGAGLTWYGGLILVVIALAIYLHRTLKTSPWPVSRFLVLPLAFSYGVGRLGCIASGDGCYGTQCPYNWPVPFAMAFPHGAYPWSAIVAKYGDPNVMVYNTPLFEALFAWVVFAFLWFTRRKDWPGASVLALWLFLHGIFRFFVEFIRLNPNTSLGLTQAQLVSLCLIMGSLTYFAIIRKEMFTFVRERW